MLYHQKRFSGISLLEVLLVFLVAMMISLLGVEYYRHLHFDKDVFVLQKNRDILMHAVNTYYHEHANDRNESGVLYFPDPKGPNGSYKDNLKDPTENGLWPKVWPDTDGRLLPTRFVVASASDDSNYDVKIIKPTSSMPHFALQVIITIVIPDTSVTPSDATANWFKQAFNAKNAIPKADGQIDLIWEQLPEYSVHSVETNLWVLGSGLQQFKHNSDASN